MRGDDESLPSIEPICFLQPFASADYTDCISNPHLQPLKISESGLFDRLKDTVDKEVAKACFEKIECQPIKMFKISAKVDQALRRFYLVEELVFSLHSRKTKGIAIREESAWIS